MVIQPKLPYLGGCLEMSESELDEEINLAVAADTNVGKCGVGRERVGTYMVGRLGIWMVGVATVAVEEIDCSYVVAFAAAAAAGSVR